MRIPKGVMLLGGLAVFLALQKKSAVDNLDYRFSNFRFVEASGLALHTEFDFIMTNRRQFSLRLDDLTGEIQSNGQRIADFNYTELQTLRPGRGVVFHIPLTLPLIPLGIALGKRVADLLKKRQQQPFRFVGSVVVNGIEYPFDETVPLAL